MRSQLAMPGKFVPLLLSLITAGLLAGPVASQAQLPAPLLLSPSDGDLCVIDGTPLEWGAVSGAASYVVTLYPQGTEFPTLGTQLVPSGLVAGRSYDWEVVAVDSRGFRGNASRPRSFTARNVDPALDPVFPTDGTVCVPTSFTLDWSEVVGASQYDVRYGPPGNPSSQLTTSTSSAPINGLNLGADIEWQVRVTDACGFQGEWSQVFSFTTSYTAPAPDLLAPSANAFCNGTVVFFDWTDVPHAEEYDLRYGPPGNLNTQVTTPGSEVTLSNLPADVVLEWQVRTTSICGTQGTWSVPATFGTFPALGAPAEALFPPDEALCLPNAFSLSWSAVPGAVQYDVRYGPPGNLNFEFTTTSTSLAIANLDLDQDYEWQVQASSSCGDVGMWSPAFRFRTRASTVPVPVLTSPADGSTCAIPPVVLRWTAIPDAASYDIEISPGPNPSYEVDVAQLSPTGLVAGTEYTWRVRATNVCGLQSDWSSPARFSLDGNAPSNPTVFEATGQDVRNWTNLASLEFAWNAGSDDCSIQGYSIVVDSSPSTLPDLVVEAGGNSFQAPALPDGMSGWAHLRTVDRAGNGAATAMHAGPYWVDTVPPTAQVAQPQADLDLLAGSIARVEWTAGDALSGLASVELWASNDGGASFALQVATLPTTQTLFDWTVPNTPGEEWLIELRVGDEAGNLSSALAGGVVRVIDPSVGTPTARGRTALLGNHPNPFNPRTSIRFRLAQAEAVELTVFDVAGRRVRQLANGPRGAGLHEQRWDGTDDHGRGVTSGTYLIRLQAGRVVETGRMVLVR